MTFHEGVDLVKREGVPILAAHDGEVIYSASGLRGYGNLIVLRGDNLLTIYGHNRRNLVRVGQRVRREQQIAELGKSGKATGPHLHFETRVKDTDGKFVAVDPMTFFPGALGD
jgi:lipoprotein NlpD